LFQNEKILLFLDILELEKVRFQVQYNFTYSQYISMQYLHGSSNTPSYKRYFNPVLTPVP